jgi:cytochrome P450
VDVFDHHSKEFAEHFREIFQEARATCPVVHSDLYGGYHVLTRHADVTTAFRNYKVFASERPVDEDGVEQEGGVAVPENPFRTGFLEMDPPQSINLRRLVNPWFNPRTIDAGRPRIAEVVGWAFDRVVEQGTCDLIVDLASPFQCMVILDILGIPLDRWKTYKEVIDKAVGKQEGALEGIQWILGDLFDEVERQKEHGGEGLIAELCRSEVDGQPIEDDLTTELALMLLLGGMDTTIATIGHAVRHLDLHPEDRQRLIDDPSLIPSAVEEILRYYVPAPGMARTVLQPVTVSGYDFQPGDRVICSIASANFDEEVFEHADQVDIARSSNPHLTFGTGTHRCIGSDIARANAQTFIRELLRRIPDFSVDHQRTVAHDSIPLANGYEHMPIRYTPSAPAKVADSAFPAFAAPRILPVS